MDKCVNSNSKKDDDDKFDSFPIRYDLITLVDIISKNASNQSIIHSSLICLNEELDKSRTALSQSKNVGCVVTTVVRILREIVNDNDHEIKVLCINSLRKCTAMATMTSTISQLLLQDDSIKVIFDRLSDCHDERIAEDLAKIAELMGRWDVDVIEMILYAVSVHTTNQNIIRSFLKLVVIAANTEASFQDILKRQLLKLVINLFEIVENQSDDNINLIMNIMELVSMDNLGLKQIIQSNGMKVIDHVIKNFCGIPEAKRKGIGILKQLLESSGGDGDLENNKIEKMLELYVSKYPWQIDDEIISEDRLLDKSILDAREDCVERIKTYRNESLSRSKVRKDKNGSTKKMRRKQRHNYCNSQNNSNSSETSLTRVAYLDGVEAQAWKKEEIIKDDKEIELFQPNIDNVKPEIRRSFYEKRQYTRKQPLWINPPVESFYTELKGTPMESKMLSTKHLQQTICEEILD